MILVQTACSLNPSHINGWRLLFFVGLQSFLQRAFDRLCEEQTNEDCGGGGGDDNTERQISNNNDTKKKQMVTPAPLVSTLAGAAIAELHRRTAAGSSLVGGDDYYHGLSVTVRYNQARLHEATYRPDLAEKVYKSILLQHPTYVDCEFTQQYHISCCVRPSTIFLWSHSRQIGCLIYPRPGTTLLPLVLCPTAYYQHTNSAMYQPQGKTYHLNPTRVKTGRLIASSP